ncbi:MAG: carboxypeptidase-like regulatory domain-containing protein [Bacteroidales bacterium]|jgi:hypothetical protein
MNKLTVLKGCLTGVMLLWALGLCGQHQMRLSGFVMDKKTGEVLIGANISLIGEAGGTSTDNSGYFSLAAKVPCSIRISFVGYQSSELTFVSAKDTVVQVKLEPGRELASVEIKGLRTALPNVTTLKIAELQLLPSLSGKPDVLKSMQLLPGIQAQNEGSSLLLVRGGDPGQNLYLFDNIPVIYVNHLGGFMSVFNPDIINSIDLYKGGFPARFGGRLSSVVDITQREGDKAGLKGSLSIGITDLSMCVEGPTKLRNSSFIFTARKTLTDPLMAFGTSIARSKFVIAYGFHDLNGKFTWKPDERNSFHFNLYQGDDYLNYWSDQKSTGQTQNNRLKNIWGNWLTSGRWIHVVSPRVLFSNTLSYTRYRLDFFQSYAITDTVRHPVFDQNYRSSVSDLSLRLNLKFQIMKSWSLETGLQASYLSHNPNSFYKSDLHVQPVPELLRAFESALYADNKINIAERLEANLGLRMVGYSTPGFNSLSIEPRLHLSYKLSPKQYLDLSYQRVTQNEQLLFTPGSIMNSEIWVPAGSGIDPAVSEQFTLGWNGSFRNGMFTAELSAYYKTLNSLTTYREGYSSLMGDQEWRSKIVSGGTGTSTGVEFMLKKQYGAWTGFVSYAWSHTTRKYPQINKGLEFVFDFDRPHTASLNISHQFNEKWSANLVWVYQTGLPYTPVLGRQLVLKDVPDWDGTYGYYEVLVYGERNSARIRDYHRLDIGATLNTMTKRGRKATWTFSVYNLYNRHNPYYYYYNTSTNDYLERAENLTEFQPMNLYQMSFFPVIPSVSYKVYFDKSDPKRVRKPANQRFKKWLYQEK